MLSDEMILGAIVFGSNLLASLAMDKRDKRYINESIAENKKLANEKYEANKNLINKLFSYKDDHEKETAIIRLSFSKEISELSAICKVNQTQYAEILRRLDTLDRKIDRIEEREENNNA